MIPLLKKTAKSFFLCEEGKVSKQSLLKIGVFFAAAAVAGVLQTNRAGAHGSDHGSGFACACGNCDSDSSHDSSPLGHGSSHGNVDFTHHDNAVPDTKNTPIPATDVVTATHTHCGEHGYHSSG